MKNAYSLLATTFVLSACGGVPVFSGHSTLPLAAAQTQPAVWHVYQPLAAGDAWKYTCRDIKGGGENGGKPFTIYHKVLGTVTVAGHKYSEFSLQIPQVPSRPLKVNTEVMLLNDAPQGDLWIHGYMIHGKVHQIKSARIVSNATPQKGAKFSYMGPTGKLINRFFFGIVQTNPTPLGVFTVADYEESNATHDYGYAKGFGIAEEDHGPNFEVDCLVEAVTLH